ncbi:MAG: hypothetical protein WD317_10885 [Balneolaceae bacterium]
MLPAVKWVLVFIFFTACSSENPEFQNLSEKISYLVEDDRYEEALAILDEEDREKPAVRRLLEKTHLNYGLYNMNTFNQDEMRTRMNEALRQFTEVLRINADNEVAKNHISQILRVYETIPDRQPEEDVIERLREVGINIQE